MIDIDKTFVMSDHHFLEWKGAGFYKEGSPEGDAYHVDLWNSIVGPDDLVLYVGDFCEGDEADISRLRGQLNGKIVLIKGNHDKLNDEAYRAVFDDVVSELRIDELNIRLIHTKEEAKGRLPGERLIYGHEHRGGAGCPPTTSDSICVCAKWHFWKPITLAEAIKKMDAAASAERTGVDDRLSKVEADIQEILHEWHTPKAERILREMGVSERNWRLFARYCGVADGMEWSFRRLAEEEGNISHVRAFQIVKKTEKRLRGYVKAQGRVKGA